MMIPNFTFVFVFPWFMDKFIGLWIKTFWTLDKMSRDIKQGI